MRITTPDPQARIDLDRLDLADPALYTTGDAHLAWQTLRRERPVFWNQRPFGRGFWALTRYADVRRVLHDHATFTSERGTVLGMVGLPDPAAGTMMHASDPPCHTRIRTPLGRPLSAAAVQAYGQLVRRLVRAALEPLRDGATVDVAQVLTPLPVAVVAALMDLPPEDIAFAQRATYASVAPLDPHYRVGTEAETLSWAHGSLMDYFTRRVRQRQQNLSSDLISHLITMEAGDRRLTTEEVVVNCYSLLVGGVVTTAQVMTALLMVLAARGGGTGRWAAPEPPGILIEEALRWSSPTTHFMRCARHDVELHGVRIRSGEPVTAWIASANRDEAVFDDPYSFDPGRTPNRHIAFGTGAHRCIGNQLARLVLRIAVEAFFATVDHYEPTGPPVHLVSNVIAGVVSLPIRVRARSDPGRASGPASDGGTLDAALLPHRHSR